MEIQSHINYYRKRNKQMGQTRPVRQLDEKEQEGEQRLAENRSQ